MTNKTTMPEPVAWRSRYKNEPGMIGQYPWSYVEHSLRQPALNNYDIEALITTAQAEAYAADKVKEALLEAYGSMQELHMSLLNDATLYVHPAQVASFAANRISALIPKEQS